MITQCPHCKQAIVVKDSGENFCPKCSAKIYIGEVSKEETDRVLVSPDELRKKIEESAKAHSGDYLFEMATSKPGTFVPPWERRMESVLQRLFKTWKAVSFQPARFFYSLKTEKNAVKVFLYGWILTTVGMFVASLYRLAFLPEMLEQINQAAGVGQEQLVDADTIKTVATLSVFFSPLIAGMMLLFYSALYHGTLRLIGSANSSFTGTLKVVCYAASPMIFMAMPVMGGFVAFIWNMVLCITGLSMVHKVGQMKAMLAVIFPPLVLYFIAALLLQFS